MAMTRKIIISDDGAPPTLVGQWTVREIEQAAQYLANWLGGLIVPETMPPQAPAPPPVTIEQGE